MLLLTSHPIIMLPRITNKTTDITKYLVNLSALLLRSTATSKTSGDFVGVKSLVG